MPNYPYDDLSAPLDTSNLERLNNNYEQIQADIQSVSSASVQAVNALETSIDDKLLAQKNEYTGRLDVQKTMINNLVVEGDSSPEAAQARVGLYGEDYDTLKDRIDGDLTNISVNQINKNRGKFDQTYMTDEFLQQIAGDTPVNAVPADYSLTSDKFTFPVVSGTPSRNLFDKTIAQLGKYLNGNDGTLLDIAGFFTSAFIKAQGGTQYTLQPQASLARIVFYNAQKQFISSADNASTITAPASTAFVRISHGEINLDGMQFEKNNVATPYETFGAKVSEEDIVFEGIYKRPRNMLFTFNEAFTAWENNEKFPIAFFGDSTTDGLGTTSWSENVLGSDHIATNAYPYVLQEMIRGTLSNNTLRVYNAGFSGQTAQWAYQNINSIFGSSTPYADVKMVGISYGINDRLLYNNEKDYRNGFKQNVQNIIEWFYQKGVQPFLLTTQASVEPGVKVEFATSFPLRTSASIAVVANEVKKELAELYEIPLIDMNLFTENFLLNSSYSLQDIIGDTLHFQDVGHRYEAGVLFAKILPFATFVTSNKRIDYSNQRIRNSVPSDLISYTTSDGDGFKLKASYTKANTNDLKIADFWVFIDMDQQVSLRAYKTDAASLTYVKVDGVQTVLDTVEKNLGQLEIGLHHLEVFTGASDKVDFKGFKLV